MLFRNKNRFDVIIQKDLAPSVVRTSQIVPVRDHPAKCDKKLKVTLLANEWNSSRGGGCLPSTDTLPSLWPNVVR